MCLLNRLYGGYRDVPEGQSPIEEAIEELQRDVEGLRDDVDKLMFPQYIFIGDSYSQGWTPDGDVTGWSERVCNSLGITGGSKHIYHSAGAGFKSYGSEEKRFIDLLNEAYIDLTAGQRNFITDIVVGGGYNDLTWTNPNDIVPAIQEFVERAKLLFGKKIRVHVFPLGWTLDTGDRWLLYNVYCDSYTQCTRFGASYHGYTYACLNHEDALSSDGIHPSDWGQKLLSEEVINGLEGAGDLEYSLFVTSFGSQTDFMATTLSGDQVMLGFNGCTVTLDSVAEGDNDLGLVSGGWILGWTGVGHKYSTFASVSGVGAVPCEVSFRRKSDGIHFYFTYSGTAIGSSTTIYIHGNTWTTSVVFA